MILQLASNNVLIFFNIEKSEEWIRKILYLFVLATSFARHSTFFCGLIWYVSLVCVFFCRFYFGKRVLFFLIIYFLYFRCTYCLKGKDKSKDLLITVKHSRYCNYEQMQNIIEPNDIELVQSQPHVLWRRLKYYKHYHYNKR